MGCGFALLNLKFPLGRKFINLSYDVPFNRMPIRPPKDAIIVYLDDASHKDLGQSYSETWDRSLHAKLLERLTADHSKAVVFDIVFSDPGRDPQADEKLAQAIKANGSVVLAADYTPAASGMEAKALTLPYEPFKEAALDHWGIPQFEESQDLVVREHYHGPKDEETPSLTWKAAELIGAAITKNEPRFKERWVNYYGPPGILPSVSFFQAIAPDGVPSGYFSNKVVFVGAHVLTYKSGERKDEFRSPYTSWESLQRFMPGVEVHTTIFLNLLHGDWLRRFSPAAELAVIVVFGIIFGYGLTQLRPWMATLAALIGALLFTLIVFLLFWREHVWFPWLIVVAAQVPVVLLWSILFNSVQLYVQNKLYEQSLALYLSPKLVKKFSGDKELLKPGAKKEMLTVLFSDIAGFTTIAEGMDSDELARNMNSYFQTAVSQCIHHTDGTIVKYIGDAIFAFWNAPDLQNDHQIRACEAALRFRDQPLQTMNGQPLVTRIGLHTGVANVGNFGSSDRVDYTALGENINLASRMEGLNKYLGTEVLITRETQEGIGDRLITRPLGKFQLKGFEKVVEVFELIARPNQAEGSRPWRESFAEAAHHFQKQNFDAAEAGFRRTLELKPNDGPSKFYLAKIAELRSHPLPDGWAGEIELKEK